MARMVKRIMTASVAGILLMVLLAVGYLYASQGSMIYFPSGYSAAEMEEAEERFELLRYETSAGLQTAFLLPPARGRQDASSGRVWLFFSGNASRALDWTDFIANPDLAGEGFLLVDYPGYGANEGKPTPSRIEESIDAAVAAVADHLGEPEADMIARLAVLGYSLGAAAALVAAEEYEIDTIVLISPFTSMRDMAAISFGRPLSLMLSHNYDNRARLRAVLGPEVGGDDGPAKVTIIHGEQDSVIPVAMGRELAGLDRERITFHAVPGADHDDVISLAGDLVYGAMR